MIYLKYFYEYWQSLEKPYLRMEIGRRGLLPRKERRKVELRTAVSPRDVKHYTTERLREEFLIQNLFVPGEIKLVYSHIDRITHSTHQADCGGRASSRVFLPEKRAGGDQYRRCR